MSSETYLLDTHVVLWLLTGSARLDTTLVEELADPATRVLVSAVVPWEVAIKRALGKLRAPSDLLDQIDHAGLGRLPISLDHAVAVEELPSIHRDPFDRMLVAQARSDDLTLLTADRRLARYDVPVRLT